MSTRLLHKCWSCGKEHDAVTDVTSHRATPKDGDISLCLSCGVFGVFHGGVMCKPTPKEESYIASDPHARQASGNVHLLMQQRTQWERDAQTMLDGLEQTLARFPLEEGPPGAHEAVRDLITGLAEHVRQGEMSLVDAVAIVEGRVDQDPVKPVPPALHKLQSLALKLARNVLTQPGEPPPHIVMVVVRKGQPASIGATFKREKVASLLRIGIAALETGGDAVVSDIPE